MSKEERICQFHKISIRKDGDIYPCCLGLPITKLGNIFEENIFEKIETANISCECELFKTREIKPDDKMNLQKMHIMFSHECQARCICCWQEKEAMPNEEEHLKKLMEFIERYKPKYITVLGGEVLVQPKALDWVENIKNKYPDISFDIVTNLCVGENTIKRAEKIFDDMTISILGFTENTYKKIMGLDFNKTMRNFDYLQKNTSIKLRPKYLTMPTNMYELPLFFDWALNQKTEKIYLHNISGFHKCCNMDSSFWQKTFISVEEEMKKIFDSHKEQIISKNKHFISLHRPLSSMLKINEAYIENNGFKDIVKITS